MRSFLIVPAALAAFAPMTAAAAAPVYLTCPYTAEEGKTREWKITILEDQSTVVMAYESGDIKRYLAAFTPTTVSWADRELGVRWDLDRVQLKLLMPGDKITTCTIVMPPTKRAF